MSGNYILEGTTPVECDNLIGWAKWFATADKKVAETKSGDIRVSTVFLGIDHALGDEPPMLFETMIFGGEHDEDMWRYSTWDDAVAGHAEACKLAGV